MMFDKGASNYAVIWKLSYINTIADELNNCTYYEKNILGQKDIANTFNAYTLKNVNICIL